MSAERLGGEAAMTTPHAPEGGDGALDLIDFDLLRARLLQVNSPYAADQWVNTIVQALTAARAEGATAERARLAGLASEEDREMVDALDSICRSGRVMYLEWLEAYTTLLARLAAARGEDAPPSDAQSARQPGDPCDCGAMWAERDRLRTALAAAERAGDDDGDGEYILSLQRQLAEVKAQLDAALKAVDVTPFTEEIRHLAALVAAVPDALTEARRDGAELALGVVFESDPLAAKQVLSALLPPPGAEVGRG